MNSQQNTERHQVFRLLTWMRLSLLLATLGFSYGLGWISFGQGDGTFAIEIRTSKAKRSV